LLAYFVRRFVEIEEGVIPAKYAGEAERVAGWFTKIKARSIPYQSMYPKTKRCKTADLFWNLAPQCIRNA